VVKERLRLLEKTRYYVVSVGYRHKLIVIQAVKASDVVVVPAGTEHQFINTSKSKPLELVTIYSPAEHDPQTVHQTKEEGDEEEDNGKDEAPEWSQQSKEENQKKGLVKAEGGPYENGDDGRHNRKID
jgi:oxalate decarboxylase/phosphoglucose isomerase-like protein (cupin superfamily)